MKKVLLLVFCIFLFAGCSAKNSNKEIVFDNSFPLALAPDISWALVTDQYVTYRESYDWHSEATGHVRKGEILQVLSKSIDDNKFVWYKFEIGWLPSSSVSIFSNRMKAQTEANRLKE